MVLLMNSFVLGSRIQYHSAVWVGSALMVHQIRFKKKNVPGHSVIPNPLCPTSRWSCKVLGALCCFCDGTSTDTGRLGGLLFEGINSLILFCRMALKSKQMFLFPAQDQRRVVRSLALPTPCCSGGLAAASYRSRVVMLIAPSLFRVSSATFNSRSLRFRKLSNHCWSSLSSVRNFSTSAE